MTNFPFSLDTFVNPSTTDPLTSPSHAAQHANANDAIGAVQAKVGVDGSVHTDSLDYRIAALESNSSSPPFVDSTAIVKGSADSTKKIRFEVDGLTTGTTRVVTVPDADITLARTDAAQTFTGIQTFANSAAGPDAAADTTPGSDLVLSAGRSTGAAQGASVRIQSSISSGAENPGDLQTLADVIAVGDDGFANHLVTITGGLYVKGGSGSAVFTHEYTDSATNTATALPVAFSRKSTGTVANGFGSITNWKMHTDTGSLQNVFQIQPLWATAANATRKTRVNFRVFDTSARTAMTLEASGTAPMIGFLGASAVVRPSGTGETTGFTAGAGTNVTDASTFTGNVGSTAYRISDVVKALKNLGLLAQ